MQTLLNGHTVQRSNRFLGAPISRFLILADSELARSDIAIVKKCVTRKAGQSRLGREARNRMTATVKPSG